MKASIHRVGLRIVWLSRPDVKQWSVNDIPACLSVTDAHSLLVTCDQARKIKEFSADGKLLRQVMLRIIWLKYLKQARNHTGPGYSCPPPLRKNVRFPHTKNL